MNKILKNPEENNEMLLKSNEEKQGKDTDLPKSYMNNH